MKKILYIIFIFLFFGNIGNAQTLLLTESFEVDATNYDANTFDDLASDYFDVFTAGTLHDASYTPSNIDGLNFMAAEDCDAPNPDGNPLGITESCYIVLSSQDVSAYSQVQVTIALAAINGGAFEYNLGISDFIDIEYAFDGNIATAGDANVNTGTYTTLGSFRPMDPALNGGADASPTLYVDTNDDGYGDGTGLTNAFQDFTFTTSVTGTNVSIRIKIYNPNPSEELAVDNIRVLGTAATTAPAAYTIAASSISTTGATLNGTVNANNASTVVTFEYGLTTSYGSTVTADQSPVTGTSNTSVSASITSLNQGTTYHYRVKAQNSEGTTYSSDQTFTTQNTISSIARTGSNPTNASSVSWTVTFDASVTGLSTSNFALANSGLTSPSITSVTGSGTTWTVTVNTGSGNGTLGLNLDDDTGLNAGLSNITYTGEVYTIDKTTPSLTSSSPEDNVTNVTLSENIVLNFDDDMVAVTGNVAIRNASDNSIFEQIPIGDAKITISSSQVTINPAANFTKGNEYYIEIDATALDDDAGNSFAGISGTSALNFTTVDVVINEVVTDPQQDWSSSNFTSEPGGSAGTNDEWLELYINTDGIDFTGWTIELLDGSDVIGDLTNTGAFDISNYITSGIGTFNNSEIGDYLVLGNVDGTGAINNTGLTINLKDPGGVIVDAVIIGGAVGQAPSGNSDDIYNESVQRFTNGLDTDTDDSDFTLGKASIGEANTGPSVTLTEATTTISEAGGTSTITASLSAVCSQEVSIPFTVNASSTAIGAGTDYSITASPVTIAAGLSTTDITITITSDALDENNETVIVDMGTPVNATQGATTSHTATITDDDDPPTVAFNASSSSGLESVSSANLQVDLSVASSFNVTVDYTVTGSATGSGTDYTLADGTLTINAGDGNDNITIASIVDDLLDEDNETVIVTLSNPTNATLGTNKVHTYTITDNDDSPSVAFNTSSSSGAESVSSADLQVDLSAVSGLNVTVDYVVTGTASGSGTDYTLANGTLTINAGDDNDNITIASIVDDLLDENNEEVVVTLSNPTNATLGTNKVHTYTITDNDPTPTVAFSSTSSSGLESVNSANLQVDLSAASGLTVSVDYTVTGSATGSGTDYTLADGTLTISAGDANDNITIASIVDDLLNENNETVIVTLSNPTNATLGTNKVHTYTITDNDDSPSVEFNTTSSSGLESVSSADLQVDLSAVSGLNVSVDYTVTGTASGSGTDYTLANGTLTINAGDANDNITIASIVDDLLDEDNETVIVTLSNPVNATLGTNTIHTYTIIDNDDVATVTTQDVSDITSTSATGNGNITDLGVPNPTQHGFCYNETGSPSLSDSHVDMGAVSATGTFSTSINFLDPNTTYYVRAYATNTAGTAYGDEVSFTTLAEAPTATTNAATSLSGTGATLNGTINAKNASTVATFEYGLTTAYGSFTTAGQSPVTGIADTDVSAAITGLEPNTEYHYRVVGVNSGGTTNGSDQTFTTGPIAPTVTTTDATDITAKAVTFHGIVNANNSSTVVTIEMGTTTAYGIISEVDQSPVTGSSDVIINYGSYGYTPNTTYHYRVVGVNAGGTTYGEDVTFTTLTQEPIATTVDATEVGSTTATLKGTVNGNELSTTVTFEYGLTTSYGTTVTADQSPLTSGYSEDVNKAISGLAPNTIYHYRVIAVNSEGTAYGDDMTFTTATLDPFVYTGNASSLSTNSATLNGSVNPNDYSTTATFEYGLTDAYGSTVTADQSPVTGNTEQTVSADISGLSPYTTYHFRTIGVSSAGAANGIDRTFTTNGIAPTISTQAVTAITETSATGNGNITDLGIPDPTAHGVCWNTTGTPTTGDSSSDEGAVNAIGAFTSEITSLDAGTTYYVRAYATNAEGTVYGSEVSFETLKKATVVTQSVSNVDQTSAVVTGWIGDHGNPILTQCGVCWSTSESPTIADSKTEEGAMSLGETTFFSNITGLSPNTIYYVRAYATNDAGTAYGEQLDFTTAPQEATVTTQSVTSINITTAVGNGNITALGAPNPTAHGVCWNTTGTPTTEDSYSDEGAASEIGAFTSDIISLIPNTTYYVRAYATNTAGTVYGDEVSFESLTQDPTTTTIAASEVEVTTAILNGTVNANDFSTTVTFEYGLTDAYGQTMVADQSPVTGNTEQTVSAVITGLSAYTTYHFRVKGESDGGSAIGSDLSFTTDKYSQTITFDALPDKTTDDADFAPGATSDLGLDISYSSNNEQVATIVDNQVHIIGAGTTEITASQSGNDTVYAAAPVSQNLTVTEATGIDDLESSSIKLYPNPAKDILTIEFEEKYCLDNTVVSIIDLKGAVMYSNAITKSHWDINVSDYPQGLYIVEIKTKTEITKQKLLIQ